LQWEACFGRSNMTIAALLACANHHHLPAVLCCFDSLCSLLIMVFTSQRRSISRYIYYFFSNTITNSSHFSSTVSAPPLDQPHNHTNLTDSCEIHLLQPGSQSKHGGFNPQVIRIRRWRVQISPKQQSSTHTPAFHHKCSRRWPTRIPSSSPM
jgi:hypothetical protein